VIERNLEQSNLHEDHQDRLGEETSFKTRAGPVEDSKAAHQLASNLFVRYGADAIFSLLFFSILVRASTGYHQL